MKTDGTETLGFLLHDATRLVRKRFEAEGRANGLSAAQWRALVRIAKEEGVTQTRLADLLEIEPISVSRLLDRMEEGGWIERRAHTGDRRVRLIFPTDKSRTTFAAIKSVAGEVYETALSGLTALERQALMNGLATVVANLSASETLTDQQIAKGAAA